jgi:hypothetical protein
MADQVDEPKPRPVTIIINTRSHPWVFTDITFEQVVELAYPGQPVEGHDFTVRYSRGPNGHGSGSLTPGHIVEVKNGMVFDVYRTSRS